MVKKRSFITLTTLFLTLNTATLLFAGEFTASVNNTQVQLSESFPLTLTLKDTSPIDTPSVSSLNKQFIIHSQQYSTNTSIINGKMSSSVSWKLYLIPKSEGVAEIPSLTVNTEEGLLSTQPIRLHVTKEPLPKSTADNAGPSIIAQVNNVSPYKNEPFIYTAFLTSKTSLYNVKTQKIQLQDAIVELVGEPKLEEKFIDGVMLNVVEFTYLITPLKTGSLTIPPMVIQGAISQTKKEQLNSFSTDDLNLFSMMQGFERFKPFTLTSEEIQVNVQPAIAEVSPWLPAKALSLEEKWSNDQTLRVGEPISRGFLIKAQGVKASQLPHLEDLQTQNSTFKMYADKPEEQESVSQGIIHSQRQEQYTFIPQQPGTWVLPEISINWWDTVKKEKRTATISARTLQILPPVETAADFPSEIVSNSSIEMTSAEKAVVVERPPSFLYGIIGILTFLLGGALLWGLTLQKKIASLTEDPAHRPLKRPSTTPPKKAGPAAAVVQKDKKEKLPDLNPT